MNQEEARINAIKALREYLNYVPVNDKSHREDVKVVIAMLEN